MEIEESDESLAQRIEDGIVGRVRYAASERVPHVIREAAAGAGMYIADSNVLMNGIIEMLWYFQEQSISLDYHRYGNLGVRSSEKRGGKLP